jgi:hypothetical protein
MSLSFTADNTIKVDEMKAVLIAGYNLSTEETNWFDKP